MYSRPSRLSIPPQLGILGGSPNPRKLSEASPIKSLRHQVHFPSQESGETADQDRDEHIERCRGQSNG